MNDLITDNQRTNEKEKYTTSATPDDDAVFCTLCGSSRNRNECAPSQRCDAGEDCQGQVLDSEGSPLAGVSIKVEGTRQGVVSDVNGNFVLNLPGGQDANLVFSFIGMKTQVVHSSKAGNNGLTVTMKDDATVLGEVVATGMQQVKSTR